MLRVALLLPKSEAQKKERQNAPRSWRNSSADLSARTLGALVLGLRVGKRQQAGAVETTPSDLAIDFNGRRHAQTRGDEPRAARFIDGRNGERQPEAGKFVLGGFTLRAVRLCVDDDVHCGNSW